MPKVLGGEHDRAPRHHRQHHRHVGHAQVVDREQTSARERQVLESVDANLATVRSPSVKRRRAGALAGRPSRVVERGIQDAVASHTGLHMTVPFDSGRRGAAPGALPLPLLDLTFASRADDAHFLSSGRRSSAAQHGTAPALGAAPSPGRAARAPASANADDTHPLQQLDRRELDAELDAQHRHQLHRDERVETEVGERTLVRRASTTRCPSTLHDFLAEIRDHALAPFVRRRREHLGAQRSGLAATRRAERAARRAIGEMTQHRRRGRGRRRVHPARPVDARRHHVADVVAAAAREEPRSACAGVNGR